MAGPQLAQAGGLMLYEIGSDNTGLANAGAAARAQGPATIASNIAGLSYLEGTQVSGGLVGLVGHLEVDYDASTNVPGGNSGNAVEFIPGASFFASHRLDEQWTLGFGTFSNFGLSENYDNDWSGRYYMQNATLGGLSFVPGAAYRLDEQWSLGVGLQAMYGIVESQMAVNNDPLGVLNRPDGQLKYKDEDWGYGGNLGLIFAPRQGTRIGLSYTSKIDLDFEDGLDFSSIDALYEPLNGVNTKLDMTVPQTATLSLYQQVTPRWAMLASAGWQDWSEFGEVYVQLDTDTQRATTLDQEYDDTWHLSVGSQYQATEQLLWNLGVAYDSSPVSDSKRSWALPMGDVWRLGTGLTYALDPQTDVNFSYALVWFGDISVSQTRTLPASDPAQVSGSFNDAWIQAFSGSMTWRF
ncbi:OmpP1/FadL family transporter [Pseudomonas sp. N040]|uniref:OmpP1/FadL family transporter n=1 Tax=Pseudomonas sp. N040 TaxID=2785325 RepID=UPI0018A27F6E|nr:outer membrane protein transport protein [Pseudomonas sp. N040]MBF7728683.1 outer membrane protein transport protein [Pseudomonas sp. N040]MBW7012323.1 outer membrane protein transport protein [Pseudomonas sp. N040]